MGLGLPQFINMITSSRKKIYVSDAQALITKAEYQLRAKTSEVEKPDPGDCIVMSLNYLYDTSFDSPPYEGEYVKDASFVVIKNVNNGDLEYSVMLVENIKKGGNSYQGIKLVSESGLKQSSPGQLVSSIKSDELYYVGDHVDDSYQKLDKDAINKLLDSDYLTTDVYEFYA